MRELLKIHKIFDYFDYFVFSDEISCAKPARKPFETIELKFPTIKTKEMLHIGDNSQTDILGALNSNWNAVIFGNKECSYNIDRIKSFVFFEQKF
jgi:FMN phosphatase YigB (HAD superfamily)